VPQSQENKYVDLSEVTIRARGSHMAAQVLADVLGSPLLVESVSLDQVIGALRGQSLFLQPCGKIQLPLAITPVSGPNSVFLSIGSGIDIASLARDSEGFVATAVVRDVLAHYPSLQQLPAWESAAITSDWFNGGPDHLELKYPLSQLSTWDQIESCFDE